MRTIAPGPNLSTALPVTVGIYFTNGAAVGEVDIEGVR